jgi:transposase
MEIQTIGIDLGKTVFHLVGLNSRGKVVVRKKCSRDQILRFTANLQRQVEECDKLILRIADEHEDCRRIQDVPGIGPMTATATIAAIGNGSAFKKGRGFAGWLGVVPGEHSAGGKQTLTDTCRRGNRYLRKLFVQGAHAVLQQRMKRSNGRPRHARNPGDVSIWESNDLVLLGLP